MNVGVAFFMGSLGAFVIYFLRFGTSRLKKFVSDPKHFWPIIIFDLLLFIICGGLVSSFLICPTSQREAFLSGGLWQGSILAILEHGRGVFNDEQ